MRKINSIKKKLKLFIILFFIIFLMYSSLAYYTNINRYFEDSRKSDGYGGYALKRTSNEFIVDGCGSGTMLDSVTGLCWDKNMNHNGSTLQWATANTYNEPIWSNSTKNYSYPSGKANYPAFSYCEDLSLGGNTDWRLPGGLELLSLGDESGLSGTTCTTLGGFGFTNCQSAAYWTYKEYTFATTSAKHVNLNNVYLYYQGKSTSTYVICVRSDY